jgi:hypothetical protein
MRINNVTFLTDNRSVFTILESSAVPTVFA